MCMYVLITQSCLTLCDPMDYNSPASSAHGILQARILEWLAIPFSRGSSQPRDLTWVSFIASRFFYRVCVCVCVCVYSIHTGLSSRIFHKKRRDVFIHSCFIFCDTSVCSCIFIAHIANMNLTAICWKQRQMQLVSYNFSFGTVISDYTVK